MAQRLPYVGVDPANAHDYQDEAVLTAQRLAAAEDTIRKLTATVKAHEQTFAVMFKLVSPYARKANGR